MSIENVIKGSSVDFERVTSIDGTFIANVYDNGHTHKDLMAPGKNFSEKNMIEEESRKSRMSAIDTTVESKKQAETRLSTLKIEDSVSG